MIPTQIALHDIRVYASAPGRGSGTHQHLSDPQEEKKDGLAFHSQSVNNLTKEGSQPWTSMWEPRNHMVASSHRD